MKIWDAAAATPTGTHRLPADTSSTGSPTRYTVQQLADLKTSVGITANALGSVTGATSISLASGGIVTATITGNTTFTFDNPPAGATEWTLVLTNGGAFTITWPTTTWAGATAPTLSASGVDVLHFASPNGGTTWYGWHEVDYAVGTTAGTVAAGDDTRIVNAVQTSRTVSTSGLATGGGDLSANRTITVSAASASDVDTGTSTTVAMTPDSYRDSIPYYVDRTADWTLSQADGNTEQQFNSGSARVCTIDTNANAAISVGTVVPFVRIGSGSATIDAVSGVTINGVDGASVVISTQWQGALARKIGTNAWAISGDIA